MKNSKSLIESLKSQSLEKAGLPLSQIEKVKDGEALRQARKWLQGGLLCLLFVEVFFIMYLMISQGIHRLLWLNISFQLEPWAFGLFINVAIVQTCILIRPIAFNLFPAKRQRKF